MPTWMVLIPRRLKGGYSARLAGAEEQKTNRLGAALSKLVVRSDSALHSALLGCSLASIAVLCPTLSFPAKASRPTA